MLSIRQRQLNLYYCGYYYTGKIDSVEGPLLRAAYGKFQEAKGLKIDRIYGPKTEAMLIEIVKELQRKLQTDSTGYKQKSLILRHFQKRLDPINHYKKEK